MKHVSISRLEEHDDCLDRRLEAIERAKIDAEFVAQRRALSTHLNFVGDHFDWRRSLNLFWGESRGRETKNYGNAAAG